MVALGAPLGGVRSSFTALAENLASHGFVVVTVDHPYDAPYVELWPTHEVVEPQDAARQLHQAQKRSAREADLAAVADQVMELDDEVAPVIALGCTIVASGELATQAAPLTDNPMIRAQVAKQYPRVADALVDPIRTAAAEDGFRTGSADLRAALTRYVRQDSNCPSVRPGAANVGGER